MYSESGALDWQAVAEHLQGLSDNPANPQLQQFGQLHKDNPVYMALVSNEGARRARLRQQAAAANTPPPQGTVVDQQIAALTPAQQAQQLPENTGIARVAPNMTFADGGIVALAGGGMGYDDVYSDPFGYDDDTYSVSSEEQPPTPPVEGDVARLVAAYEQANMSQEERDRAAIASGVDKLIAAGLDVGSIPINAVTDVVNTGLIRPLRAFGADIPYQSRVGGDPSLGSMTPFSDELARREAAQQAAVSGVPLYALDPSAEEGYGTTTPTTPTTSTTPTTGTSASSTSGMRAATPSASGTTAQPGPRSPSDDLSTLFGNIQTGLSENAQAREKFATESAVMERARLDRRTKDYDELLRKQGQFDAETRADIASRRAKLDEQKDEAKAFALINIGLGMASAVPRGRGFAGFLATIAEGSKAGISGYQKDLERLRSREEKLKDLLAEQRRLEQSAQFKTGVERIGLTDAMEKVDEKLKSTVSDIQKELNGDKLRVLLGQATLEGAENRARITAGTRANSANNPLFKAAQSRVDAAKAQVVKLQGQPQYIRQNQIALANAQRELLTAQNELTRVANMIFPTSGGVWGSASALED